MVLIVMFILVAGTFMEGSVLIIMLTPIFLPLVTQSASTRCISAWSSSSRRPSATSRRRSAARCSSCARSCKCPIGEYTRESMPFLLAVSAVTLLLIFVPEVVMFLPNLLFGEP